MTACMIRRHGTDRIPASAFSRPFLVEAYTDIGLATSHIEQLTGQPAERVLQLLS